MGKKWAVAVPFAALAVTVSACSGTQSRETSTKSSGSVGTTAGTRSAPSHPTTTTLRVPTTTTSTPDYSFDDSVPPPKLINTGTDYVAIAISLASYSAWLYAHHPDVTKVRNFTARGSRAERAAIHDLTTLQQFTRRLFEENLSPPNISVISAHSSAVSLLYIQHLARQVVVDRHGTAVSQRQFGGKAKYLLLLDRSANDRWYLSEIEETSLAPKVHI